MVLPHNPVKQNMLPKQNDFFTDMAPMMKQNRLKGEYLWPQVLSVLQGSFISSLTTADLLAAWDIEKTLFIV